MQIIKKQVWLALGLLLSVSLTACSTESPQDDGTVAGTIEKNSHAETFTIVERDGYHIVDIEASVVTWGGSAGGPPQRARLVLVPKSMEAPAMEGDLADATLIRTPVERVAVNDQPQEAMFRALGAKDLIVAVGGYNSYDDSLRRKARAGEIQQIGYGWHMPPTLDALVAAKPDVLVARMADLTHTQHMERVEELGIPVLPTFIDAESHYMGRVEWIRIMGLLTGREEEAKTFVEKVTSEVDRLKALAADQPKRSLLWAWYQSSGNRWSVTQRNADAALIRDANAELVLGAEDDPELDTFSRLSTERLLQDATDADCWMIRDPISKVYEDKEVLSKFKAYREECVFWNPGKRHPEADSWEVWEMGAIRPDWQLKDIIKMLHPELRDGNWRYLAPETWKADSVSTGNH